LGRFFVSQVAVVVFLEGATCQVNLMSKQQTGAAHRVTLEEDEGPLSRVEGLAIRLQ
jgi:hypothetical protein